MTAQTQVIGLPPCARPAACDVRIERLHRRRVGTWLVRCGNRARFRVETPDGVLNACARHLGHLEEASGVAA